MATFAACADHSEHLVSTGQRRRNWLATPLKLWSAISGMWTTALISAVPMAPARALDLGSSGDRSEETIAYRERLKDYDNIKKYGAERVADRDRKLFQPEGIRSGNLLFFPTVGTALVFDDNVLLSNRNRQSDFKAEVTPGLRVVSQLPRHAFDLSLGGKIVEHFEHSSQDHVNAHIKAGAALHFDHAHTLSMSVLSRLDHSDQLDPFSPTFARQLVPFQEHRASIGLTRDAGRFYGTVSTTFESLDYQDATAGNGIKLNHDAADMRTASTEVRAGYRFSPGYEVIGKLRGLRQLNHGTTTLDRDAYGYEALAGLYGEANPLLRWRLLGGYGIRDFDQSNLASIRSLLTEAEVQWLPTQHITFYATARRAISGTTELDSSGLVETAFKTRLDYEVWHNVVLSLNGDIKDHEYIGNSRRDRIYVGRVGVDWFLSKNWLLNMSYEHFVRDSNIAENDLNRNVVTVGAKLKF
ncbi:MAG: outer membrane beta-barrel protein [Hyphomicrobiaceae bacterium]